MVKEKKKSKSTKTKKVQLFIQVKKGTGQLIVLLQSAYPDIPSRLGALNYQIDFLPILHFVEQFD